MPAEYYLYEGKGTAGLNLANFIRQKAVFRSIKPFLGILPSSSPKSTKKLLAAQMF